ncbi:hypothetical protein LCGC14_1949620 [marine sediment metagenome]|uniref:Uncharacterized protein n=1 Tax=marine sediment metagenome TaxID=412755 RepID=A0A0F9FI58_9ZZZZ
MVKLSNKLNLKALVPIVSPDFPAWAFFTGPYGVCRILATLLSGLGGAGSLSRLYFNVMDVLRSGSRKYLAAFHFHGRKEVFHHRKPALRLAGVHWTEIIIPCL